MNAGKDYNKALGQALANAKLDGQPRYLFMYGNAWRISKQPLSGSMAVAFTKVTADGTVTEEQPQPTVGKHITEEQAKLFQSIAAKLREAAKALDDAELILLLELGITDDKPLDAIRSVQGELNGLPYLFTPQTEWTGGDSSKPENFKINAPHIMRNR